MLPLRRVLPAALLATFALGVPVASASLGTQATWHGQQIRLYDAQPAGRSGQGVVVAVLDGWIDRSHPDFGGRALRGADCTSGTCVAGQTRDNCGSEHGTHVAGTVASSSFGVAPRATLLPVRVLTDDGSGGCTGTPAHVAAGIRWAMQQGAKVLNLSLGPDVGGLGASGTIATAVHEAASAGAVVVFSAGNAAKPISQTYGSDALVVAATAPDGKIADYSQYGAGISVAAPGGQPTKSGCDAGEQECCTQALCITSLYPGGEYAVAAGTSMAAPHVSGLAALLFGQTPSRSRQSVLDRIRGTAHPLSGAGSGLIDASAALAVQKPAPRPAETRSSARPPTRQPPTGPAPGKPAVPAGSTPTKVPAAAPAPTATPSTVPATTPAPDPVPPTAPARALRLHPAEDEVPMPLAAVAAGLVGSAAVGVLRFAALR
jgi:subtilisin family serine protease